MSKLVLVLGNSGRGKSSSLRNFKEDEVQVIRCINKEFPFKANFKSIVATTYPEVYKAIEVASAPVVVLDDVNYLMSFESMSLINQTGYQKFSRMALNMQQVFEKIASKKTDQVYYIMSHLERTDSGIIQVKTTGKMLSNEFVLEGLVTILIESDYQDGEFVFKVKTDGSGIKTPIGMFDTDVVPNDLKIVNQKIKEYYSPPKSDPKK